MSTNLSVRDKAVKLHHKIIVSANLAQQNLFEMCQSLKEMRDSKLYKELGYSNFEDYCETEVGMKRSNAYNYISPVFSFCPGAKKSKKCGRNLPYCVQNGYKIFDFLCIFYRKLE